MRLPYPTTAGAGGTTHFFSSTPADRKSGSKRQLRDRSRRRRSSSINSSHRKHVGISSKVKNDSDEIVAGKKGVKQELGQQVQTAVKRKKLLPNRGSEVWKQRFKRRYLWEERRTCPRKNCDGFCKSWNVCPVLYGFPSVNLIPAIREGLFLLGMDHIPMGEWKLPTWMCKSCRIAWIRYPWRTTQDYYENDAKDNDREIILPT
mmetsp:Transcript_38698/g.62915  ORF Transcript_38698/g.62915 Transcript_38698/m.62915 type:complete len:204 (-) Transcript_38698:137-748(-)